MAKVDDHAARLAKLYKEQGKAAAQAEFERLVRDEDLRVGQIAALKQKMFDIIDGKSPFGGTDMADRMTIHEFLSQYKVSMTAERTDSNPAMDEDRRYPMDHWHCVIRCGRNSATIIFSMGSGHHGKEPELAEVINAMALDASSAANTRDWEDFAREFGYKTEIEDQNTGRLVPNRKAKKVYNACLKEKEQLERLFGPSGAKALMYETEGL